MGLQEAVKLCMDAEDQAQALIHKQELIADVWWMTINPESINTIKVKQQFHSKFNRVIEVFA